MSKEFDHEIHERIEIYEQENLNKNPRNVGMTDKILYKEECFAIQGAIFEVYQTMGCGFLEAVYQECLTIEFQHRNIPFVCQEPQELKYKNEKLHIAYQPDFICYEKIILELKAIKDTGDEHRAQLLNYLKATGMRLGLLVNFGHYPRATIERIIL